MSEREVRKLLNTKENSIATVDHYPGNRNVPEGQFMLAHPSGKPVRLYKKLKGMLWWKNLTRDGNEYVDKNLTIKKNLILRGELKGSRLIFNFGSSTASNTNFYMDTVDGILMSSNLGYVMHRTGSIVGVGARFQCTSYSAGETWSVDVLKNNSSVFKPTGVAVNSTGYYSTYGTQSRNVDKFAVEDLIQVKMDAATGLRATIDNVIGFIEIVFDN